MKNMTEIAGKMFSILGENNINITMISQGNEMSQTDVTVREKLIAGDHRGKRD